MAKAATQRQKRVARKLIEKAHFCNCEFCEKKSVCFLCSSKESLQRAHIIPQHIISLFLAFAESERWISFTGENIIALCASHHRKFDNFKLTSEEKLLIRPLYEKTLREFVSEIKDLSIKESGQIRLDKWALKNNDVYFGGGQVIAFDYVKET